MNSEWRHYYHHLYGSWFLSYSNITWQVWIDFWSYEIFVIDTNRGIIKIKQ
jgi:hypothetical protein